VLCDKDAVLEEEVWSRLEVTYHVLHGSLIVCFIKCPSTLKTIGVELCRISLLLAVSQFIFIIHLVTHFSSSQGHKSKATRSLGRP